MIANLDFYKLKVLRLTNYALVPTRATPQAAGFDLYAAYDYTLPANGRLVCNTDLVIVTPPGTYGRIASRSGLACKGIDVGAGVIDADYRGNVGVLLVNTTDKDYSVKHGDRIAQLILEKIDCTHVVEVVDTLDETERGSKGFGSSGK